MKKSITLEYAIEKALDGEAVLFAGAGYSFGAKNEKGMVPSAKQLKTDLMKELGLENTTTYGLETISQYYLSKKTPETLVQKLRSCFCIKSVANHHLQIARVPWKRIYTTNYDQVAEKASEFVEKDYQINPIVLSDDFSHSQKDHICIHLNGYIDRLNTKKLEDEFKLTDTSYSCDLIQANPWFEFMNNDFESASAIIIIGYSMQYDIDIKRLLSAPSISRKVIFIDSPYIDEISKELINSYGQCYTIGIQGFGDMIDEAKKEYIPKFNHSYKCFSHIYKGSLNVVQPRYEEIVKFYTEGKKNDNLFEKNRLGEYKHLLYRSAVNLFFRKYKTHKMFIALSNLGNGKSVFLDMVVNELRNDDIDVFVYKHRYYSIDYEIERICKLNRKCIVVIDNYPGHMDIIEKFQQYGHENITFLLSSRFSVNQIFYNQLQRRLNIAYNSICPIYLNRLNDQETKALADILDNNKLLTEAVLNLKGGTKNLVSFISNECKSSFSELLLKLFDSSDIKTRLYELYSQIEKSQDKKLKEVVVFSLLKNVSNYDISFSEILDLFNADYMLLRVRDSEFMNEIFDKYDADSINVRSSIISLSLIKNIIRAKDIINTMKVAFLSADKKASKTYIELQKGLVSHSQFMNLLNTSKDLDVLQQIESYYEDIRNSSFARHNPFFWEQFASAYIDMKKFGLVKKCLETALVEASKIPGFVPFQIRTVQGRYFVEKSFSELTNGKSNPSEAINNISESCEVILKHYTHPDNNLYYVFKVVKFYPMIFNIIKDRINKRELLIYIEKCSIMSKNMEKYISDYSFRMDYYVSNVKKWNEDVLLSIKTAKEKLKFIKQ